MVHSERGADSAGASAYIGTATMGKDIYGKVEDGLETPEHAAARLREWLIVVADVCVDYDGYNTEDELKSLVDDIRAMANLALQGASPYISE